MTRLLLNPRLALALLTAAGISAALPGCGRKDTPYQASQAAAAVDQQIDWSEARLLAVQDMGRYKTLDSFAREYMKMLSGREHLPGLSPMASLLEWLFHRDAYLDTPLVRVKDEGLRVQLMLSLSEEKRQRIELSHRFTPREIDSQEVETTIRRLERDIRLRRAVNRVREAQAIADRLEDFVTIVPRPGGDRVAPWLTPQDVLGSLSDAQLAEMGIKRSDLPAELRQPVPGLSPDEALAITVDWTSLRAAWLRGDAAGVQTYLQRLGQTLPQLAGEGVYPTQSQRSAEASYYAAGKFTGGWLIYFTALLVAVFAMVTGWRTPWVATLVLLLGGLAFHAYGLGLRWYILGRIPVANDFESLVAATWIGIVAVLLIELFVRTRVLLVGAAATGFTGLVVAQFMPSGGNLATVPGILDDIQLRLHTVLIIWAYALIFVAAIVAVVYLLGYYAVRLGMSRRSPALATNTGATLVSPHRPILAGATPGDEAHGAELPAWLNRVDWAHLIILNLVFVLLFVGGIVLGAWWADYSWGRPWGWDPKEVFALNTWLIYAVLLHVRFVAHKRGLWTAWLSIAGCAMMAFNWFFVNYFIASVHSYA